MGRQLASKEHLAEPAHLNFGPVTRKALVTATNGHQGVL